MAIIFSGHGQVDTLLALLFSNLGVNRLVDLDAVFLFILYLHILIVNVSAYIFVEHGWKIMDTLNEASW